MQHLFSEIAATLVHPIKSDLGVQGDINIHAIFPEIKQPPDHTLTRSHTYRQPIWRQPVFRLLT
jgi:hypothetical protein